MRERLSRCELCPRRCGVNRLAGGRGYCGAGAGAEVYRWGPHRGEEPPLSGTRGSGTVFFSRCTMRCLYCQNFRWSQGGEGRPYGTAELARMFLSLQDAGCHNLNLVSPTPWLPQITEALGAAEKDGFALPVVYNTSGFERVETLAHLDGRVDVYLTDLRYAQAESAAEGSGAPTYVEASRNAFREMWRQVGPLRTDRVGVAVQGVVCRLLVLPGRAAEAAENLRWLAENAGTGVAVSVMAQYLPLHRAAGRAGWDRRITEAEYEEVCEEVRRLGFREGWTQEFGQEPESELVGAEMEGV